MTEIKVGDRVHVEFDGIVHCDNRDGTVEIRREVRLQGELNPDWIPTSACTVIVPPIAVGDVVTYENAFQLPEWSIVAKDYPFVRATSDGRWWINDRPVRIDDIVGATVLRIGGGS